jgi:hypothetical protein
MQQENASAQAQPAIPVAWQFQQIRRAGNRRQGLISEQVNRCPFGIGSQVELCGLGFVRQVVCDQDGFIAVDAQISQHRNPGRCQEAQLATAEGRGSLSHSHHLAHAVQQRAGIGALRCHVDTAVAERFVINDRVIQSTDGSAVEKPALTVSSHCMGVRTPSRSSRHILSPMPIGRDGRRAGQDLQDGGPIRLGQRHEDARHEWKVEVHVELIAGHAGIGRVAAKVRPHILGPLIGLGEEHRARCVGIHKRAQPLEVGVRLGQVLAIGALTFVQVGRSIHPEGIHALVQPK